MTQDNRGGPSSRAGKPGDARRDGRPGGGNRGGPRKGGFGKGPAKQVRAETYESVKELTRGAGFRIDKFVVAEKGTHRLVKTEYRLIREGLAGQVAFGRLVDAQAAATAPLPEPEPAPAEASAEMPVETSNDGPEGNDAPAETSDDETPHSETPHPETGD